MRRSVVVVVLDMFQKALREYEAVSAETTFADGRSTRTSDRRAPLRLDPAARRRLRLQLRQASRRSTPAIRRRRQAWTRGDRARARRMAAPRAAVAESSQPSRSAAARRPRRARPPRTLADPRHRRRRHRPAGRRVRRPALHAAQGHHRHPARARDVAREQQADVVAGVLGRRRGSRLGGSRELYGARRRASSRARSRCPKPEGAGERPVAALTLDDRVEHSLDELASALGETEFTEWLMASLRAAYRPGVGMADAFARWLETLLGPHGLVVFDSSDPGRQAARRRPVRARARRRRPNRGARHGGGRRADGPRPPAAGRAAARQRLALPPRRRAGGRSAGRAISSSSATSTFTVDALAEQARTSPDRFSPNVLLRPIVQDTLFPTICYVAGPSELAYLGQLRGVYEQLRHADAAHVSARHARRSSTRPPRGSSRRYDVPIEELQPQDESALNRLLESQLPQSVEQAITDAEDAMRRTHGARDRGDAGRRSDARRRGEDDARRRWSTTCAALQNKMIQAAKRRDETLRRQFTRAQAQIFPLGHAAGTHARRRLLPESLRPGGDRPAAVGTAARARAALGDHDLSECPQDAVSRSIQHVTVTRSTPEGGALRAVCALYVRLACRSPRAPTLRRVAASPPSSSSTLRQPPTARVTRRSRARSRPAPGRRASCARGRSTPGSGPRPAGLVVDRSAARRPRS